jgi:hypothetical protein
MLLGNLSDFKIFKLFFVFIVYEVLILFYWNCLLDVLKVDFVVSSVPRNFWGWVTPGIYFEGGLNKFSRERAERMGIWGQ